MIVNPDIPSVLSQKVRRAAEKEAFQAYAHPNCCKRQGMQKLNIKTSGGRLTFWGVYNLILLTLQNQRRWEVKTCEAYDRIVCSFLVPELSGKAFEDYTEDDFAEAWSRIQKKSMTDSRRRKISFLIRAIVAEAYEEGLTLTSFWGVPGWEDAEEEDDAAIREQDQDTKEGMRLAEAGVRIARTMPLETEVLLIKTFLDNYPVHGEYLGGLIMLFLGNRTSEATGYVFGDLCEICPGFWGLICSKTSNANSRDVSMGGKTDNAGRLLPVPGFLADILLNRRDMLARQGYTAQQIQEMPIACKGRQWGVRCSQAELNSLMKDAFRRVGVEESMVKMAYMDLRDDPRIRSDCEKSATAYLLRHQAATAFVACGLPQAAIYMMMGHRQEDPSLKKWDFSNPDQFRLLADRLNRRPATRIFNRLYGRAPGDGACVFQGERVSFSSDQPVNLQFNVPQKTYFHLVVSGKACSDPIKITCGEGIEPVWETTVNRPCRSSQPPSILPLLQAAAERAEKCLEGYAPALDMLSAMELVDDAGEDSLFVREDAQPASSPAADAKEMPPVPALSGDRPGPVQRAGITCSFEKGEVIFRTTSGSLLPMDDGEFVSGRLANRGERAVHPKSLNRGEWIQNVLCRDIHADAWIVSRDGFLFQIPAETDWETLEHAELFSPCMQALRNGGILLRAPAAEERKNHSIVFLGADGGVMKTALSAIRNIPRGGLQVVTPKTAKKAEADMKETEIVGACLCPDSSDCLLVTKGGLALRISPDDLRARRSTGPRLLNAGILLKGGDQAAACIPYPQSGILCLTKNGKAVRLRSDKAGQPLLKPHCRGTGGTALVALGRGDQVSCVMPAENAFLLITSDGYAAGAAVSEINPLARNTSGIAAVNLKIGQQVAGAVPIILPEKHNEMPPAARSRRQDGSNTGNTHDSR